MAEREEELVLRNAMILLRDFISVEGSNEHNYHAEVILPPALSAGVAKMPMSLHFLSAIMAVAYRCWRA